MATGSETGGCLNCYACALAARAMPSMRSPTTGKDFARRTKNGPRWTGDVELMPHLLDRPLRWRRPRMVFVNSMSDLFHESLPDEAIDRVFAVMALARQHTFQVLTKRPARMRAYLASPIRERSIAMDVDAIMRTVGTKGALAKRVLDATTGMFWGGNPEASSPHANAIVRVRLPLPNVWLGISCENQPTADARIPQLLETPAAVRFISAEPLLAPIDLAAVAVPKRAQLPRLDWVIAGGESGPGSRPCDVAWIRGLRDQCREAGVAFFAKQLGRRPTTTAWMQETVRRDSGWPLHVVYRRDGVVRLKSPKGGDMTEWPADLRVREFPR